MTNPKYKFALYNKYEDVKGMWFVVPNPELTYDFLNTLGQMVEVGGKCHTVKKVDRYTHCAPWFADERIGLLVEGL